MRTRIGLWAGGIALLVALAVLWLHARTVRYDDILRQAATRHQIEFHLVKSIVFEESWFRAGARGAAGELGLMQVTRLAAADYAEGNGLPPVTETRLFEPRLNVEIGSWYLRKSLDRYRDSPAPALFALLRYNAGEVHADRWLQEALAHPVPPGTSAEAHCLSFVDFPRTREYARRILRRAGRRSYWI